MHRDVECGTFQRDRIAEQIFGDNFFKRTQRSIHREWRKVERERVRGERDPFEGLEVRAKGGRRRG